MNICGVPLLTDFNSCLSKCYEIRSANSYTLVWVSVKLVTLLIVILLTELVMTAIIAV